MQPTVPDWLLYSVTALVLAMSLAALGIIAGMAVASP
jgi:hypothetical protein